MEGATRVAFIIPTSDTPRFILMEITTITVITHWAVNILRTVQNIRSGEYSGSMILHCSTIDQPALEDRLVRLKKFVLDRLDEHAWAELEVIVETLIDLEAHG